MFLIVDIIKLYHKKIYSCVSINRDFYECNDDNDNQSNDNNNRPGNCLHYH